MAQVINTYQQRRRAGGENTYTYKGVGPPRGGRGDGLRRGSLRGQQQSDLVDAEGTSVLEPDRNKFTDYRLDVVQVGNSWRDQRWTSEPAESC